ncbi:hypothetical protein ACIA5D_40255 [Actinoplanes sp. NPDC051513]|uniref:hypothetical protein n=1 Tax=Actinoplanes sp. NPDC051513 TaxID=3363908 RepID=UPI0037BAA1F0
MRARGGWLRDRRLRTKVGGALAVAAIIVGVVGVLGLRGVADEGEFADAATATVTEVDDSQHAIADLTEMSRELTRVIGGFRI